MTQDVKNERPEYERRKPEWRLMRDASEGETAVKDSGVTYLPMPSGFKNSEDGGAALYGAYQYRAKFPEIVAPALLAMVGVIHGTEIQIDLPDPMLGLWERATRDGLPLEAFHRRVTSEILQMGRYSILAGAASTGSKLPYLTGYAAESLINWSDERDFFVLDESGLVRDGFSWEMEDKYRVLELRAGHYEASVYQGENLAEARDVMPTGRGGRPLDEIPLVVIGPQDLSLDPKAPPLIGVARSAVALYQLSADYRWQLFMSGQETLFVFNADAPDAVGAGVVVALNAPEGGSGNYPNVDARYVGPTGAGINAHRVAMQDEVQEAANAGAKLFNSGGSAAESGEARRIRYAAETASLTSVAQASCAGLEKALRHIGRMMGLGDTDIEAIVVHAPESFVNAKLTAAEVQAIMGLTEKSMLSLETGYEQLQAGGWASAERDWEEEADLIEKQGGHFGQDDDPGSSL